MELCPFLPPRPFPFSSFLFPSSPFLAPFPSLFCVPSRLGGPCQIQVGSLWEHCEPALSESGQNRAGKRFYWWILS